MLRTDASVKGWGEKRYQVDLNMSGEEVTYKQSRVTGSKASISNLPKVPKNDFSLHSDGQNGSSDLFIKFILEGGGGKKN